MSGNVRRVPGTPTRCPSAQRARGRGRPKGGAVVADRALLLAAAERAIASIGPSVTMEEIAAEASISKPTLYRTIGDKAALVDALSDILAERVGKEMNESIAASSGGEGSSRDKFEGLVRTYLATVVADRDLYLFVNMRGQSTASFRSQVDRSARQLVDAFASAQGVHGSASAPRTWGHSIIGALQIATLMWLAEQYDTDPSTSGQDNDVVASDLTHLLWPGVAAIFGLKA